jgi:UDP-N-acetylmuramate-alanine ligase
LDKYSANREEIGSVTGKWYHFIGIGGVGMSGLAQVLLEMGMRVSGSDLVSSPVVESLRQRGAQIAIGHQAENIVDGLDAVVVSSAIPPSNIELSAACSKGLPVMTRGELLAKVMESYQGIAVTGSHGKTTTSAMIAVALAENGLDPTYLIGGHISELGGNAGLGKGRYLVAESDESDGSFLKQKPFIAVITNIDDDHLDYYRDISGILQAFQDFLSNIRRDGFALLCSDSDYVCQLSTDGVKTVTYGIQGDLHDIGKNIFKSLAESAGFEVYDLGTDTPPEDFASKAKEVNADIVGMSGILTLASNAMKDTVESLKEANLRENVKIIIGGNLVTSDLCSHVGADAFTTNAAEGVKICQGWVK